MEIKELKTKVKVVFPEESEIFMAEEFLAELKEVNLSEKPVELDLSAISTIDTVFVQLLISIIKTLNDKGNKYTIKTSEVLEDAAGLCGVDFAALSGGDR